MNSKHILTLACAAGLSYGAWADGAKSAETAAAAATEEQLLQEESGLPVSVEFGLAFDSKFLSYGLVDNNDPILTPSAAITFFDHLTFGVSALFDTTKYGKKWAGYGNRAGKYFELDPEVSFAWAFSPEDYEWLPTTVETSVGYIYEYHPRSMGSSIGEPGADKQFVTAEIALPDLWLEPTFGFERNLRFDDGTYLEFWLGHTFTLIEGEGEGAAPVLTLRPSIGQGFGNAQRVKGYLSKANEEPLDHAGLMDTTLKLELGWQICDNLALGAYVQYSDFIFDSKIRQAARRYEASGRWDESWNVTGGLALTLAF